MPDDLKRAVVWKSLLIEGADYCRLMHTAAFLYSCGLAVGCSFLICCLEV